MADLTPVDFERLCESLGMTDIIRLQDMLSKALVSRFEKHMALVFSDVVGSTPYFAKFGDEAGRKLQQRHLDILQQSMQVGQGRIVDTAGDGAFLCFPTVEGATLSMIELHRRISADNLTRSRDHQLQVRTGIHYGPVLTDGMLVTGESVNLCSRVSGSANPGEIRLTKDAFLTFSDTAFRVQCRMLPPIQLKGIERPAELVIYEWRDRTLFPSIVRLDTGEEITLPDQDIITFGRLKEQDGFAANDIVLQCATKPLTQQISRWHFELRRQPEGFVLRPVSEAPTEVNGKLVGKAQEVSIRPGTVVRVGDVLSIQFLTREAPREDGGATLIFRGGEVAVQLAAARGRAPSVSKEDVKATGEEPPQTLHPGDLERRS